MRKKDKYLQDVIITSMFQLAVGYMGFHNTNKTIEGMAMIAVVSMQLLVFAKANYFYKIFKKENYE